MQADTQHREGKTKRKEKDIETARDADESGEVYAVKPFFFHFAKRDARGASVSLCRAAEC